MLSTNTQVNTLSYVAAQQASAGSRSFLPVPPSQYIYSQFEHVSGVPANEGGISVSQLQILNSLIDNIMQKKSTEQLKKLKAEDHYQANIEKLILEAQKKMQKQDALAEEIPYLKKALEAGTFLSLHA
ncbi:MAG: hypothetical protein P1P63_09320 [Treponemataceae bacterium]